MKSDISYITTEYLKKFSHIIPYPFWKPLLPDAQKPISETAQAKEKPTATTML